MSGRDRDEEPASVRFLDHTADVGFEVEAGSPERLFDGAARALNDLILGMDEVDAAGHAVRAREAVAEGRTVEFRLDAADAPALLADWLRELIYLFDTEGVILRNVSFRRLDERTLDARVSLAPPAATPVREIKGVTYHGLDVHRSDTGRWRARVILDV